MENLCFRPFCSNRAECKCKCTICQIFCELHASNHMHFPSNEYFIEKINNYFESSNYNKAINNIESSNNTESNNNEPSYYIESSEHPPKKLNKVPDMNVRSIIVQIYAKIICLRKVKLKFSEANQRSSYFIGEIKNSLTTIEEHDNYLIQLLAGAEQSASINELPESFIKITNNIKKIESDIDFFEKLNEVLKLEYEIKSYWLAKITKSSKKVDKKRCQFHLETILIENWCFKHGNSRDSKFVSLTNKLRLIKELIQNNFEVKYFFRVNQDCLQVYGAESWRKSELNISSYDFKIYKYSPSIELPNSKVFCILKAKNGCIIDLKTMRISQWISNNNCVSDQFALAYYENSVFVFSSSSNSCSFNYLEKYDLARGIKINLPKPSTRTSYSFYCTIYRNSIIFFH